MTFPNGALKLTLFFHLKKSNALYYLYFKITENYQVQIFYYATRYHMFTICREHIITWSYFQQKAILKTTYN